MGKAAKVVIIAVVCCIIALVCLLVHNCNAYSEKAVCSQIAGTYQTEDGNEYLSILYEEDDAEFCQYNKNYDIGLKGNYEKVDANSYMLKDKNKAVGIIVYSNGKCYFYENGHETLIFTKLYDSPIWEDEFD